MAKFIRDYDIGQNGEAVFNDINAYLVSEGYKYVKYKGQDGFKKGNGFVSGPTFFKLTFYGSVLRLETWLAYAWLPGVYSGEIGPDDFVGAAVKGPWRSRIAAVDATVRRYGYQIATPGTN